MKKFERKRIPEAIKNCPECARDVSPADFLFCPQCRTSLTMYEAIETSEPGPEINIDDILAMVIEFRHREKIWSSKDTNITDDTTFDDLGYDSLQSTEQIMFIEEAWDIDIPDDMVNNIMPSTSMREFAETLLAAREAIENPTSPPN